MRINTTYTHPTGDGNEHVPAGGTVNQILRCGGVGNLASNVILSPDTPAAHAITLIIAVGGSTVLTVTNDNGVTYTATPTLSGATHTLGCASTPTTTQYFTALAYLLNQLSNVSAAADGATSVTITADAKATSTYDIVVTGTAISGGHFATHPTTGAVDTTVTWASPVPTYTDVGRQLGGIKTCRLAWWPGVPAYVSGNGLASTIVEQFEASRLDSDAAGHYYEIDSDNETGESKSDVYIASTAAFFAVTPISNCYFFMRFKLPTIVNVRFFAGLCQYTDRDYITTADEPARIYSGYHFSTQRGDTNFQFAHDDSATQTLVDTGVAPDTDVVYDIELEYSGDGTALRGRISNAVTGAILMADTMHTSESWFGGKLSPMAPYLGLVTLEGETKQFRFYRSEVWA